MNDLPVIDFPAKDRSYPEVDRDFLRGIPDLSHTVLYPDLIGEVRRNRSSA